MNQEFQNLRRQWGINSAKRKDIIDKMRKNLKLRNGGKDEYTFGYTSQGLTVNISTVDVGGDYGLFAIDGDMQPQGL